ncbi:MAG: hypothetical protein LBJ92_04185 [Holosporales bacterium]|jgi:hypothetical protein|nr:hypothetical protein [Holosporales bacterium]
MNKFAKYTAAIIAGHITMVSAASATEYHANGGQNQQRGSNQNHIEHLIQGALGNIAQPDIIPNDFGHANWLWQWNFIREHIDNPGFIDELDRKYPGILLEYNDLPLGLVNVFERNADEILTIDREADILFRFDSPHPDQNHR